MQLQKSSTKAKPKQDNPVQLYYTSSSGSQSSTYRSTGETSSVPPLARHHAQPFHQESRSDKSRDEPKKSEHSAAYHTSSLTWESPGYSKQRQKSTSQSFTKTTSSTDRSKFRDRTPVLEIDFRKIYDEESKYSESKWNDEKHKSMVTSSYEQSGLVPKAKVVESKMDKLYTADQVSQASYSKTSRWGSAANEARDAQTIGQSLSQGLKSTSIESFRLSGWHQAPDSKSATSWEKIGKDAKEQLHAVNKANDADKWQYMKRELFAFTESTGAPAYQTDAVPFQAQDRSTSVERAGKSKLAISDKTKIKMLANLLDLEKQPTTTGQARYDQQQPQGHKPFTGPRQYQTGLPGDSSTTGGAKSTSGQDLMPKPACNWKVVDHNNGNRKGSYGRELVDRQPIVISQDNRNSKGSLGDNSLGTKVSGTSEEDRRKHAESNVVKSDWMMEEVGADSFDRFQRLHGQDLTDRGRAAFQQNTVNTIRTLQEPKATRGSQEYLEQEQAEIWKSPLHGQKPTELRSEVYLQESMKCPQYVEDSGLSRNLLFETDAVHQNRFDSAFNRQNRAKFDEKGLDQNQLPSVSDSSPQMRSQYGH